MTARQISRKLIKAKFNMNNVIDLGRDMVEIIVWDGPEENRADYDLTERAADTAAQILGFKYAFRTGCGSWIVEPYDPNPHGREGDYCTQ